MKIPFLGGWTSINPSYFDVNYRGTRFWHTAIWIMKLFRRPWRGHEEDKVWHRIDTCWVLMIHVGHDHVECWELWWRLLARAVPNPLNSGLKAVVPCSFPGIAITDEHDLNLKITWPESQIHVMGTQCDAAIAEPQKAKPTCCSTSPFASVVRIVKGFFFLGRWWSGI